MAVSATMTMNLVLGNQISNVSTISSENGQIFSFAIAGSATDTQVNLALDVSQLKVIMILADGDLTLETNAANAAGGQTIAIAANNPFYWRFGCGITNPMSPDITTTYWTNAGGSSVNVLVGYVVDATP